MDQVAYERLLNQEINAEMNIKKERSIHRGELIIELRKIQVLASMHHSLVNLLTFILK
jgi:exocyst complex component 4